MNVITSLQNFSGTLPELFRDQHLQLFRQLRRTPKGHYRTACIVKLPPPPPSPNPLAGALPRRHHPALRRHLPHQDRGAQRQTRHPARRSRRYLRPTLTHPALDAVRGALATRPDPQGTRLARSRPTGRCLAPSATPPSTAANSDLRTAIGHLGPPSREASTPLLPSHWLRLRSKDRGDLAVHEPAMVPGVRTAPSPCLRPAPDLPEPASARIRCWRRQADHPARTHPPAAQDDTRIEEHTIGVSTLPRAAPRPTLLSAWQCPNRCQQPDTGDVGRGDRQPTRVRFAVRESELTGQLPSPLRVAARRPHRGRAVPARRSPPAAGGHDRDPAGARQPRLARGCRCMAARPA